MSTDHQPGDYRSGPGALPDGVGGSVRGGDTRRRRHLRLSARIGRLSRHVWDIPVLAAIDDGAVRRVEIRTAAARFADRDLVPSMLNRTLAGLVRDGLVSKRGPSVNPRSYRLTRTGLDVLLDYDRCLAALADTTVVPYSVDHGPGDGAELWRLTAREREVVHLVAAGRTNREIAAALECSQKTVEHHVGAAMRKLGVSNRTQLSTAARPGTRPRHMVRRGLPADQATAVRRRMLLRRVRTARPSLTPGNPYDERQA